MEEKNSDLNILVLSPSFDLIVDWTKSESTQVSDEVLFVFQVLFDEIKLGADITFLHL